MFAWMHSKKRQTLTDRHGIASQKSATSLTTGGSSRYGAQRPPGSSSLQPIIHNSVAHALSAGIDAKQLWKPPTGQRGSGDDDPVYLLQPDRQPMKVAKRGKAGKAAYSNPYHLFRERPGRWRLEESWREKLFPKSASYPPTDRMSGTTAIYTLPITRVEDASDYQSHFKGGRDIESQALIGSLDKASKKAMPRNAVPLDMYRQWRPLGGNKVTYTWETTPPLRLANSGGAGKTPFGGLPYYPTSPEHDYWIAPFRSKSGELYAEVFSPSLFNTPEGWRLDRTAPARAAGV